MIISKTVVVGVGCNKTHYKNKGYDLSHISHKNEKGKYVIIMGSKLEVKVEDLLSKSSIKVYCSCDICGKERWLEYDKRTELCHTCAMKQESYKINNGNAQRGKKRTPEQRQKMSESMRGVKKKGKDSELWKDSLTDEIRNRSRSYVGYDDWRLKVFQKYSYRCQKCGKNNCNINAHHIESYFNNPELRIDVSNGIVLCQTHHKEFHKTYGKTYNTRQQMEDYLKDVGGIPEILEWDASFKSRQGRKNLKNKSSKYVGVSKHIACNSVTWVSHIAVKRRSKHIGSYKYEVDAALAYNMMATLVYGDKAVLNTVDEKDKEDITKYKDIIF